MPLSSQDSPAAAAPQFIRPPRRNYLSDLFSRLTPSWMGLGAALVLYVLLTSTVISLFMLHWAAQTLAHTAEGYAAWVGLNCLGFVALSFHLAVRRRQRTSFFQRVSLWLHGIPLAIALIAALAYASIAGSVFSAVNPTYGKLHIFHSIWFLLLMVGLAVNLVLCSYDKSLAVMKLPGRRDFRSSPGFYTGLRNHVVLAWPGVESPAERAREAFRSVHSRAHHDGTTAYVQRGVFARFGPTVIHIGLLVAMAAGGYRILSERIGFQVFLTAPDDVPIASSRIVGLGLFDSQILIEEGQTTDRIRVKVDPSTPFSSLNSRDVRLDFTVKCHNFEAEMYPGTEVPRYFASLLEISDAEGRRLFATVDMNTAVVFNGYKFSQNSYSMIPEIQRHTYELMDVATGARFRTDLGPHTRNWVSPRPELRHLLLEIAEGTPGTAWRLLDTRRGADGHGEPIAGGIVREGPGEFTVRAVRFYPHFDMTADGPVNRSDELRNPALMVEILTGPSRPRPAFVFFDDRLGAVNFPDGLEMTLLDVRRAQPDGGTSAAPAPRVQSTGDTPPIPTETPAGLAADASSASPSAPGPQFTGPEAAATDPLRGFEFQMELLLSRTGDVIETAWVGARQPMTVSMERLPLDTDLGQDEVLRAAQAAGEPYVLRRIGPAPGFMTILGVIRDPSLPWLYLGCLIVIFGTVQAFASTYREVWMLHREADAEGEPATTHLALRVRGSGEKPFEEMEALVKAMTDRGARVISRPAATDEA